MRLEDLYAGWRKSLICGHLFGQSLGPPLILRMAPGYELARRRILIIGQETFGWQWTKQLRQNYPDYPLDWPFEDVSCWNDFVQGEDALEALAWAYEHFAFARRQPQTHRSPFWSAFREIGAWCDVGLMWTNLVRADFDNGSILRAPTEVQDFIRAQEGDLLKREIAVLQPDICVFFTGPNYDHEIEWRWPGHQLSSVSAHPERELARVIHPDLPRDTFRTYHPAYLRRTHRWHWINDIRNLIELTDAL